MRIAIIHHSEDLSNDYGAYVSTLIETVAREKGYTITDYHQVLRDRAMPSSANILLHIIIPASGKLTLNSWYKRKLPRIFKSLKIETVICTYAICTSANIPQILIIPDAALLQASAYRLLWQRYAIKKLEKSLAMAKQVITYSYQTQKLMQKENIKIVPYTAVGLFRPLEWHDKLYIKSRFAENKEYFISVLPDDDEKPFVELLRAFSKFKKWQQSSMQLLLLPKEDSFSRRIDNKLDTYKYKSDVKLINDADEKETSQILASAYAYVHVSKNDADLLPVIIALQCALPVIGYYNSSVEEYCSGAAILIREQEHEELGNQLINLYKDETLRTNMSEAALSRSLLYRQTEEGEQLWEMITAI